MLSGGRERVRGQHDGLSSFAAGILTGEYPPTFPLSKQSKHSIDFRKKMPR
jgi:hypothetical protein